MLGYFPASGGGGTINRGDFNGDGIPDVIVGNNGGSALTVFLGNGDGTFKAPLDSGSFGAWDITIGDFDGDGKLDVAIAGYVPNGPQGIQIMLGNGDGTFAAGQMFDISGPVRSVTTADFDGDGKLDLAVGADKVYLFKGAGDGTFTADGAVTIGTQAYVPEVRVGDFNGDGKPDIVAVDGNSVYVLWGTGPFTFNTSTVATYPHYLASVMPVAVNDVNQDGITDLVPTYNTCLTSYGADACPAWQVFLGVKGQQSLKSGFSQPPATVYQFFYSPIAADINGDGFVDVVSLANNHEMLVWLGNSNGTFQTTPLSYSLGSNGSVAMVSGDFNRDGKIDFATSNVGDATVSALLNATPPATCKAGAISPSVTECQPVNQTYTTSPLKIVAKSTDTAHAVTSMQVYVNNALKYSASSNSLNYSTTLASGAYSVVTKAWDSSGANFITNRNINVYTGSAGQTCATPLSAVTVCLPTQNETTTTSVQVLANSASSFPITAVQVYIDGKLVYNDTSQSTYVNSTFSVSPGQHSLVIKAWDSSGKVFSQTRTITAK